MLYSIILHQWRSRPLLVSRCQVVMECSQAYARVYMFVDILVSLDLSFAMWLEILSFNYFSYKGTLVNFRSGITNWTKQPRPFCYTCNLFLWIFNCSLTNNCLGGKDFHLCIALLGPLVHHEFNLLVPWTVYSLYLSFFAWWKQLIPVKLWCPFWLGWTLLLTGMVNIHIHGALKRYTWRNVKANREVDGKSR